jgi:anti-anti-sigma factor
LCRGANFEDVTTQFEEVRGMDRRRTSSHNGHAYRDKQLVVTATSRPVGLRFVGAVDASNVGAVSEVLAVTLAQHPDVDVHVDVSGLEFADVSGIRALVAAAESADHTRRFVLHGLPALMRKVMDVVGWSELPALNISSKPFPAE